MASTLHAIDFLGSADKRSIPSVCVVYGDESFFKRLVMAELRKHVAGDEEDDFAVTTLGPDAEPRDVFDELSTGSLFGSGRRLIVLDDADAFVSRHRAMLEDYVGSAKGRNVLLLDVRTWPSNTRLYKAVAEKGLQVECTAGQRAALTKWLVTWAHKRYDVKLDRAAAETLVDIVGDEVGLMAQELEKLAAAAGASGQITPESVQRLVGSWRTHTTWEMLDAALAGNAASALAQLDRLLLSGEEPIGILAQMSSTLRRFAAALRVVETSEQMGRKPNIRAALETSGFKSFIVGKAETQFRQLGRQRARQLYRWLLEADLALKGSSSQRSRARIVLERLIARMSSAADPRKLTSV
ncbi:MAG TPA: DNA polymerase III subunit delta [Pirellulales bacterium]|nr:DNA polymerase III subunit delta [Pirellulales bacterium]